MMATNRLRMATGWWLNHIFFWDDPSSTTFFYGIMRCFWVDGWTTHFSHRIKLFHG
jgi:hypothetical protein